MTREELADWLTLARAPGLGPMGLRHLLARFGTVQAIVRSARKDGALPEELRTYLRRPDTEGVERDLAWCDPPLKRILTWEDPEYPSLLAATANAPPVLFLFGDPGLLQTPQLAIVGSRNPTPTGRETAFAFARHLAAAGLTITSGLALGVDAAAHGGALAAPGHTIAVAGTGLDRVYPARNRELAHAIVDGGGLLVSEFSPGTPPVPANFPRRNRIISGLSLGTLVVEAALRSGSLTTARQAGEQGREVFAIPGSIHNPLSRGCHRLIRDGAKLVETAQDVLEELAPQLHEIIAREENLEPPVLSEQLEEEHRRVLECVGYDPIAVDLVVDRSGLTPEKVSSILLFLELRGDVAPAAGGCYMRVGKRA